MLCYKYSKKETVLESHKRDKVLGNCTEDKKKKRCLCKKIIHHPPASNPFSSAKVLGNVPWDMK